MLYDNSHYDSFGQQITIDRTNISKTVINSKITLDDIASEQYRVTIVDNNNTPLNEIDIQDTITTSNQYKVNYKDSNIYFHSSKENTIVKANYIAIGKTVGDTDFNNNQDIIDINNKVNVMGNTVENLDSRKISTDDYIRANGYSEDIGVANSYVITTTPTFSEYTVGQTFKFKAKYSNTGVSTLNVNGLGAINILKYVVIPLSANDILANQIVEVIYDGANFQVVPDYSDLLLQLVPVSTVIHLARSTPPNGWLKTNGDAVSRTTYSRLFSAIGTTYGVGDGSTTFNLPDTRGRVIRDWDDGKGIDVGRVFGSTQEDALKQHTHDLNTSYLGSGYTGYVGSPLTSDNVGGGSPPVKNGVIASTGGTETRVKNIAFLGCIKY